MQFLIHSLILTIPLLVSPALPYPYVYPKAAAFLLLVELLLLLTLLQKLRQKRQTIKIAKSFFSPFLLLLIVFLASESLAAFAGADPIRSFFSDQLRMNGVFLLFHAAAWFFLLVVLFHRNAFCWHTLIIINTSISFVVGLYALTQRFTLFPEWVLAVSYEDRVTSTLGNPIYLGHYLLLSLWLTALAASHEQRSLIRRILYGSIPILFFVIFITANRSTIAIAVVGITVFAIYSIKNRAVPRIFLALLGIILVALPVLFFSRQLSASWNVISRVKHESFIDSNRLTLWNIGIRAFLERPILGWGRNNFEYAYYKNVRVPEEYQILPSGTPDNAHNTIVETLVASGIVGLAILILIMINIFWSIRTVFKNKKNHSSLSALYFSAFFISAALQDLTIFDTPSTIIVLVLGLAMLHHFSSQTNSVSSTLISNRIPRGVLIASILGVGILSFTFTIMPAYASYISKKAWGIFPYEPTRATALHRNAMQWGRYLAPEIRQIYINNVIASYNNGAGNDFLVPPIALAEANKSFMEHPLSVEWIIQYATLLRIDITENKSAVSKQKLRDLFAYAVKQYPAYPDILFEQLQYFLAINDQKAFDMESSLLALRLPADRRTYWFKALSSLMKNDIQKTVDNLLEAEGRGYDIFIQPAVWKIIAAKAAGKEAQRVREILTRALQMHPEKNGLRDALRIAEEKKM
ncbi:O-antigen ligase family protein [Candidatus Uhrbacteria bacterium]|nr:O-antigen ligase family protein [Candidatus Uhrbacteria bacterium]